MVGGNVDHIHDRDLYSAARPRRRNGLITIWCGSVPLFTHPFTRARVVSLPYFEQQQFGTAGIEGVKANCTCYLQVESAPNSAPMLAVARNLRMERDREEQIQKQKQEQRSLVSSWWLLVSFWHFLSCWMACISSPGWAMHISWLKCCLSVCLCLCVW